MFTIKLILKSHSSEHPANVATKPLADPLYSLQVNCRRVAKEEKNWIELENAKHKAEDVAFADEAEPEGTENTGD